MTFNEYLEMKKQYPNCLLLFDNDGNYLIYNDQIDIVFSFIPQIPVKINDIYSIVLHKNDLHDFIKHFQNIKIIIFKYES